MMEESGAMVQMVASETTEAHAADHSMNSSMHNECCEDPGSCSQSSCHPVLTVLEAVSVLDDSASALAHFAASDYLNPPLGSLTPPPNF